MFRLSNKAGLCVQLVVLLDGKAINEYTMHNSVLKTTCVLSCTRTQLPAIVHLLLHSMEHSMLYKQSMHAHSKLSHYAAG